MNTKELLFGCDDEGVRVVVDHGARTVTVSQMYETYVKTTYPSMPVEEFVSSLMLMLVELPPTFAVQKHAERLADECLRTGAMTFEELAQSPIFSKMSLAAQVLYRNTYGKHAPEEREVVCVDCRRSDTL